MEMRLPIRSTWGEDHLFTSEPILLMNLPISISSRLGNYKIKHDLSFIRVCICDQPIPQGDTEGGHLWMANYASYSFSILNIYCITCTDSNPYNSNFITTFQQQCETIDHSIFNPCE